METKEQDEFFIYNRDYQLLGGSGTLEGVAIMLGVELAEVKAALDRRRAFVGNFQLMVKTSKITLRFVSPKEYDRSNQILAK